MKQNIIIFIILLLQFSCNNNLESNFEKVVEEMPAETKAFIKKDYRKFIDIELEKIKYDSTNFVLFNNLGSSYLLLSNQGNLSIVDSIKFIDSAKIFLKKSLEINSKTNAQAYRNLGAISFLENDNLNTTKYFAQALLIKPNDKEILYEFGTIAESIGSEYDAIDLYIRVINIDSNYKDTKQKLLNIKSKYSKEAK